MAIGWHLDERHILVDGKPTVGAFADFGLYFLHSSGASLMRSWRRSAQRLVMRLRLPQIR
jgi:malate synthase